MAIVPAYPVVVTLDEEQNMLHGKWTIYGFKDTTANAICSALFSHPSAPYEWKLVTYPNGQLDSVGHLGLYLYSLSSFSVTGKFGLGYADKNGLETIRRCTSCTFESANGNGYPKLSPSNYTKNNLVKDDGSLTLLVDIDCATLKCSSKAQFSQFKVCSDLGLALGGDYTDIVFQVGKQSIKAHKVIIAYRSKYFKTMLDGKSLESRSGVIKITDFEFAIVRGLLEFLYTGLIKLTSVAFASRLRIAADKYELLRLAEMCEDYVVAKVDKKTAAMAIISTSLVDSNRIREACLEVFRKRVDFDEIENFQSVYDDPVICKFVVNAKI